MGSFVVVMIVVFVALISEKQKKKAS